MVRLCRPLSELCDFSFSIYKKTDSQLGHPHLAKSWLHPSPMSKVLTSQGKGDYNYCPDFTIKFISLVHSRDLTTVECICSPQGCREMRSRFVTNIYLTETERLDPERLVGIKPKIVMSKPKHELETHVGLSSPFRAGNSILSTHRQD